MLSLVTAHLIWLEGEGRGTCTLVLLVLHVWVRLGVIVATVLILIIIIIMIILRLTHDILSVLELLSALRLVNLDDLVVDLDLDMQNLGSLLAFLLAHLLAPAPLGLLLLGI